MGSAPPPAQNSGSAKLCGISLSAGRRATGDGRRATGDDPISVLPIIARHLNPVIAPLLAHGRLRAAGNQKPAAQNQNMLRSKAGK
jgi:hypothetical protein